MAGYTNQLLYWDTRLCIRINQFSYDKAIANFFKLISRLGDGIFWYAMLLVAALIGGIEQLHLVFVTMITGLLGVGLYKLLKVKTVRPRPYQVHQVIMLQERPLDVFSFPSGHTLQAVLFTSLLGAFFPILLPVMLPFAILVAISRMVLGLHYPTDVLIGALIGLALAGLAFKTVAYLPFVTL
ncbi:phosphatase PAP2 family protein [Psychrobacter sp. HD31]|uniref:phosphatase PAP2 family protein n=1 Tax=Psychrobacter sp. HD31 TaxID=3112003 RepID=UPI003DA33BA5